MSRLRLGWLPRRKRALLSLRPAIAAFRSGADEEPGPPPEPDEPAGAEAPAEAEAPTEATSCPPPLTPAPSHQKLMLYASAAVVVLIVIVIVALGSRPSRRALGYVPMGHSEVQVVDMRRFALGPVYRILTSADHPIARRLEGIERAWNLSLKDDVAVLLDADDLTILIGRLDTDRLRSEFEESAEETATRLRTLGGKQVRLRIVESDVGGHEYLAWENIGAEQLEGAQAHEIDWAFAAVGSSVACFGTTLSVERFLRCHAGQRDSILKDPHFAAAYDRRLGRKAVVQRLERPSGKVLGQCLKGLLGVGAEDLRAAFVVLTSSDEAIDLTLRIVAQTEERAEIIEATLAKPETRQALIARLGTGAEPAVSRDGDVVTIEASVDLAVFDRTVVDEVRTGKTTGNLILTVLAE